MERSNLKILLYIIYFALVLTGIIIVVNSIFAPQDPYGYYGYYPSYNNIVNNFVLVFFLLILLPGIAIAVILKTTAKDVLRQINEDNQKVIDNTAPEVLYGMMQIFQSPITPMREKMSLLKCVRCGERGDLHEYRYQKTRSQGRYSTKTMSILVPICNNCEEKFRKYEKMRWVRYCSYCLVIVIFFLAAFYTPSYYGGYNGGYLMGYAIPIVIFGAFSIEWVLLQHRSNRRKFMKFSYGTDTPKIKPQGKGVWINFNDWIKFALCETAAIEGSQIQQYLDSRQPSQPQYGTSYSTPSYNMPSYSAPSYSAPSYSTPSYSTPSYSPPTSSFNSAPSPTVSKKPKFCTQCGSKMEDDSTFCGQCGNKIQ